MTARHARLRFVGLAAIAAMLAFATAQEPRFGGTLRVATHAEPQTLDQTWGTQDVIYWISANVMETVYTFNSEGEPVPHLLAGHDISEDGRTHVMHVRQGVRFHDGSEMTATDVAASLGRWMDRNALGREIAERSVSLETTDTYTITWVFSDPVGPLTYALANWTQGGVVYPAHIVEAAGSQNMVNDIVGTGPFRVADWQRGSHVRLERFDDYVPVDAEPDGTAGRRTAYLDAIIFNFVPEAAVRSIGVQVGDLDFAVDVDAETASRLLNDPSVQVLRGKRGTAMLTPSHVESHFANKALRQAVQAAVCVEDVLQVYHSEAFYDVDPSITGFGPWWTDVGADRYDMCDPDRARTLAQEAGYDGSPLRVLIRTGDRSAIDIATVLQAQLAAAGITLELLIMDDAAAGAARLDRTSWEALINQSLQRFHPILHSHLPASGLSMWQNERKEALIDDLFAAVTHDEAFAVWEEIEHLWYEDVATVKIGNFHFANLAHEDVRGVVEFPVPFFWNVWLDR